MDRFRGMVSVRGKKFVQSRLNYDKLLQCLSFRHLIFFFLNMPRTQLLLFCYPASRGL